MALQSPPRCYQPLRVYTRGCRGRGFLPGSAGIELFFGAEGCSFKSTVKIGEEPIKLKNYTRPASVIMALIYLWDSVGFCGILWDSVGFCGILWDPVGSCGILRDSVGFFGILWDLMGFGWDSGASVANSQ